MQEEWAVSQASSCQTPLKGSAFRQWTFSPPLEGPWSGLRSRPMGYIRKRMDAEDRQAVLPIVRIARVVRS
jgi:hypothetical protein